MCSASRKTPCGAFLLQSKVFFDPLHQPFTDFLRPMIREVERRSSNATLWWLPWPGVNCAPCRSIHRRNSLYFISLLPFVSTRIIQHMCLNLNIYVAFFVLKKFLQEPKQLWSQSARRLGKVVAEAPPSCGSKRFCSCLPVVSSQLAKFSKCVYHVFAYIFFTPLG